MTLWWPKRNENMNASEKPKVVVITGASAGVGRATVRAFARQGAHIALLARGRERLEEARREVETAGGKALVVPTDVADADQVEAAAAAVEDQLGPIDVWVHNAMASVFSPVKEMTPAEYRRVTEVSYLGYVYGTLAALRRMLPRDRGVIVQVGSALAYRGIPLQSAYLRGQACHPGIHRVAALRADPRRQQHQDHDGPDAGPEHAAVQLGQEPAAAQAAAGASDLPARGGRRRHRPRGAPLPPRVVCRLAHRQGHRGQQDRPMPPAPCSIAMGGPTVKAIVGNKIAPGLGDWYLARMGYEAQQYDGPADPDRPHNLWEPIPGDHGAHGDFDDRAHESSWQLWMTKNRFWLLLGGAGVACVALAAYLSGKAFGL